MFNEKSNTDHAPICNFVPGYAYYNGIGYKMAEQLVNLIEWLLGLRR